MKPVDVVAGPTIDAMKDMTRAQRVAIFGEGIADMLEADQNGPFQPALHHYDVYRVEGDGTQVHMGRVGRKK